MVDFAIPADHKVKLTESEKRDKYLDLAREMKEKLWTMKVTVIPIVIGALGKVTKGLVPWLEDLETRGDVETIKTRSARILRRVLEETCCYSHFNGKLSTNTGVKNSQKSNIIIIF